MTSIHAHWTAALGAAALLALSAAAAGAAPAYVKSTVNLRTAPGTDQTILGKIPAGSLIDASNCDGGWCAVDWQGKSGYAIMTALDMSGRVPVARRAAAARPAPAAGVPVDDDIDVVVGPPVVYGGYPYPYYRPFGYYRPRPYYGYRYGGWRGGYRRW
jgi:hypothetical protein